MTLRVSRTDGSVSLTIPPWVTEAEALQFAQDKRDWLHRHLSEHESPRLIAPGDTLPFRGESLQVEVGTGRRVVPRDGTLRVPGEGAVFRRCLQAWLKEQARADLAAACDRYSAALGRPYAAVTLRDTRSRWGSCSQAGRLMFSWRLVMAPPEILDYVAAHEVAHLDEMNHSPAFWRVVARLYGDPAEARNWLRQNGAILHRYRFAP